VNAINGAARVRVRRREDERTLREERERHVGNEDWTGLMPYIKVLNRSGLLLVQFLSILPVRSRFWKPWINPTPLRLLDDPDISMGLGLGLISVQNSFSFLFLLFPNTVLLFTPLFMIKIT
jgi:hypothetical protein